jgi:transcriptional regulator with XRE-family HTH domain
MPTLFDLMKNHKLTQDKLAEAIGVSQGNISEWKSGRSKPTFDALIKLADYFGVSIDYLVGRTDNPVVNR